MNGPQNSESHCPNSVVHIAYPHDSETRAPGSIGLHLSRGLRERGFQVRLHDPLGLGSIPHSSEDILIGHLMPTPGTAMRRSIARGGWKSILLLQPFNLDPLQVGFIQPWIDRVDGFLAVSGPKWRELLPFSPFAHWQPKMTFLNMAVDAGRFPFSISSRTYGKRRVLFIGHSGWTKNPLALQEVRRLLPDIEFGWAGSGTGLEGFTPLGFLDLSTQTGQRLVRGYDVTISLGHADANPTTVLESMCLGLLPVVSETSGWVEGQGVITVPYSRPDVIAATLRVVLGMDEVEWSNRLTMNRERVERHFNWDGFSAQVAGTLAAPPSHEVTTPDSHSLNAIRVSQVVSPLRRNWRLHGQVARTWLRGQRVGEDQNP
jgi:glycosyltransferase involved in cell wall biosynthesis